MTRTIIESKTKTTIMGFDQPFTVIGERINPTGRKILNAELEAGDFSRVEADALAQVAAGATVLDINSGAVFSNRMAEDPRYADNNFVEPGLGCAVGRSSFELARHCGEVVGIDYSQAFVDAAKRMCLEGRHSATRLDEGSATTRLELSVDEGIDRSRVSFEQGDAQRIREDIGQFDLVIACNLICRLPEPMRLLHRLPELVKPSGQLFITTPFTWLEEYTPSENWLGDGAQDSFAGLRAALEPEFALEVQWDMPFLIREHARKFQYSIAQASRWVRR